MMPWLIESPSPGSFYNYFAVGVKVNGSKIMIEKSVSFAVTVSIGSATMTSTDQSWNLVAMEIVAHRIVHSVSG
jgi:hypothetical protein